MTPKRLITWPGSKASMLPALLPLIAGIPHDCFVEVFAGGLSVTLAKPRSPVEVINDLNGELVNFYRCAQIHSPELRRLIRWQINSRSLFNEEKSATGGTCIQRAVRFWFLNSVSFGADNSSFGGGCKKKGGGGAQTSWNYRVSALRQVSRRLERVAVENVDWARCLKLYDHDRALFFLDPPYVGGKQKAYAGWSLDQMQVFADTVRTLKGRWIVTVGDTPQMRTLWHGCRIIPHSRNRGISNSDACAFKELIITKA